MSTKEIQKIVCKREVLENKIPCENVNYFFRHECDVLSLNKSGYINEFEIKISRSDFLADSKKKKWFYFNENDEKLKPNYFWYVCPENLIKLEDIKESYIGLIYVLNNDLKIIKKASIIHKYKQDYDKVLTKFCKILTHRVYLGACLLTYKNNELKNESNKCYNSDL